MTKFSLVAVSVTVPVKKLSLLVVSVRVAYSVTITPASVEVTRYFVSFWEQNTVRRHIPVKVVVTEGKEVVSVMNSVAVSLCTTSDPDWVEVTDWNVSIR